MPSPDRMTIGWGCYGSANLKVDISLITVSDRNVTFNVNLLLRDGRGNIDDPYSGFVDVMIIADTI